MVGGLGWVGWLGWLALCTFLGSREPPGLRLSHDEVMRIIINIFKLEPYIYVIHCVFLDMVRQNLLICSPFILPLGFLSCFLSSIAWFDFFRLCIHIFALIIAIIVRITIIIWIMWSSSKPWGSSEAGYWSMMMMVIECAGSFARIIRWWWWW